MKGLSRLLLAPTLVAVLLLVCTPTNAARRIGGSAYDGTWSVAIYKESSKTMDHRDQELLDKQLRHLNSYPRSDSVMMLAILAVFFSGVALGGFLFAYEGQPLQIASNDAMTATSVPNGTRPTTLR